MEKKAHLLILIFIFFVAFILRFNQLGQVPLGLYQDETAIGYNAFSISETLKDEHGNFLPLYFKSFGDYKLPVYVYLTIAPIKFFGLTEFAVRFPSAFFGFLTVIVFYFFVKELTKDKNLSIVAAGLLAINPWHLHYSRATFEVSISLFLFVLGGLLLFKAFDKKPWAFLGGTVCFIASLYSYNLARLLSPVLYALIIGFHKEKVKSIKKGELMITIFLSALLLGPFFVTLLGSGGAVSASGTLIFSSAQVQSHLLEFRSYLIEFPQILVKFFFNMFIMTIWQYIGNVINYFSIPFFFISGSTHGNHGIGNVGQFYIFEFPLIIIGLVKIIRERIKWGIFFLSWAVLVIFIASLTREAPHATRSFFLIAPLELFSALGLLSLWELRGEIKKVILLIFGVFIFYNLLYYFVSYYVRFPIFYAKAWRTADRELALYLKEKSLAHDRIIIDKSAGLIYTSLLFYQKYPPQDFQKTVVRIPDDSEGFSEVEKFGKYEFRQIDWGEDLGRPRVLLVTTPANLPSNVTAIKTISYPTRPVVLAVKEKIINYPVTEVAYVLVESSEQK